MNKFKVKYLFHYSSRAESENNLKGKKITQFYEGEFQKILEKKSKKEKIVLFDKYIQNKAGEDLEIGESITGDRVVTLTEKEFMKIIKGKINPHDLNSEKEIWISNPDGTFLVVPINEINLMN